MLSDRVYVFKTLNDMKITNEDKFMSSVARILRDDKVEIDKLKEENAKLNNILELGLNKKTQSCFNEDGNTGKCLGYGNDEPCDYCKSCDRINIKEDD